MTIFVNQGDLPLTEAQLGNRTQAHIDRDWPEWMRERSIRQNDGAFNGYMAGVAADTDANRAANAFNEQLVDYRKAVLRLAVYRLADGRPEQTFEEPSGEYDADGNEIMHVWTIPGSAPLPALVEQEVYQDDGSVVVEMVPNPAIVNDDAERSNAQAVIDATPQKVIDFAAGGAAK